MYHLIIYYVTFLILMHHDLGAAFLEYEEFPNGS